MACATLVVPAARVAAGPAATGAALVGLRCLLRALQPADAPVLARHYDDEGVQRHKHDLPFDPHFWCDTEARARSGPVRAWCIESHGAVVGFFALLPGTHVDRCSAEVGYWIARPHWGRGIASEALALATAWTWRALPEVVRLYAQIYTGNVASQRVAARCGYVCEGTLPLYVLKAGHPASCMLYGCYRP